MIGVFYFVLFVFVLCETYDSHCKVAKSELFSLKCYLENLRGLTIEVEPGEKYNKNIYISPHTKLDPEILKIQVT